MDGDVDLERIGEDVPLLEGIRTTRAIRRLRPDPVPRALIRKVCEAGTFAPSGGNRQPWKFVAVFDAGDAAPGWRSATARCSRPTSRRRVEAARDPGLPGRPAPHAALRDLARRAPPRGAGAPLRGGLHAARPAAAPGADARGPERAPRLPGRRPRRLAHDGAHRLRHASSTRGSACPRAARAARCSRSAGRSAATAGRRAGRSTSVSSSTATRTRGGGARCRVRSRSSRGRRTRSSRKSICAHLGLAVARSHVVRFANENLMVQIDENVREADVFVIQTSCPPVSDGILELLHHDRRPAPRLGRARDRGGPVLPVRAVGQEGPAAHLDRGAADGGPARDGRRRARAHASTCTRRRCRASSTCRPTT